MKSRFRSIVARFLPVMFARWVNRQRCYVEIHNDPSGYWSVRLGCDAVFSSSRSLGEAMQQAKSRLEAESGFEWTSDFLSKL